MHQFRCTIVPYMSAQAVLVWEIVLDAYEPSTCPRINHFWLLHLSFNAFGMVIYSRSKHSPYPSAVAPCHWLLTRSLTWALAPSPHFKCVLVISNTSLLSQNCTTCSGRCVGGYASCLSVALYYTTDTLQLDRALFQRSRELPISCTRVGQLDCLIV